MNPWETFMRIMQGLPLQNAPDPGGPGDTQVTMPRRFVQGPLTPDQMLMDKALTTALVPPGTLPPVATPIGGRMQNAPWTGEGAIAQANPDTFRYRGAEPSPLDPPRVPVQGPGLRVRDTDLLESILDPKRVVNDNAGQRNTLTPDEQYQQLMQHYMRMLQMSPAQPLAPANPPQKGPVLVPISNDNAGQANTMTPQQKAWQQMQSDARNNLFNNPGIVPLIPTEMLPYFMPPGAPANQQRKPYLTPL